MTVAEVKDERFAAEREVLEQLAAMLAAPGPIDRRLEQALLLVKERLRAVRERLADADVSDFPHPMAGPATGLQFQNLVGHSEAMQQVYQAIRRVSHSQATVLLRGESGTGKELVAKAIHQMGPRAEGPFVRLHCAALTESLLESELFGHERGAFTGAAETRKGRFETADGGTLFLDEIGDIPPVTQVKILRVLQEQCFERVGGSRPIQVDVRLVSATHRDLEAMVRAGTFREDLYYRLNVVPIWLPPLRDRDGDIALLIEHFLVKFNRENGRHIRLGRDLLALMLRYHWPGNVRELQNCLERLVVMAEGDPVTLESIPDSLRTYFSDMRQVTGDARPERNRGEAEPFPASLRDIERQRLNEALERTGWVQARAARLLGLTPRQVAYKIRKYGIREA
ncbi:MAG TPA: sigma 54-interacting transcriptional regulator [Nitrospiraceae bacterium]|jgi:Nif-specific regulatory protein|nr:sigma 54-interacting transcriptional regulator [Nitrospiraceae bacterium]